MSGVPKYRQKAVGRVGYLSNVRTADEIRFTQSGIVEVFSPNIVLIKGSLHLPKEKTRHSHYQKIA